MHKLTERRSVRQSLPQELGGSVADVAWILGLYLAEGFSTTGDRKAGGRVIGKNGRICWTLGKHEAKLIERLRLTAERVFGSTVSVIESRTTIIVGVWNIAIAHWLQDSFGRKATGKKIPEFVMMADEEFVRDFFWGYVDGDGYLHDSEDRPYVQMTTSSQGLVLQLQKLLTRINIFGRIYVNHREGPAKIEDRVIHQSNLYHVRLHANDFRRFMRRDEMEGRIPYYRGEDAYYLPIRSVEWKYYSGAVHNLETPDESFESFNVRVHNCEHTYWNEPARLMSMEHLIGILNQFPRLQWIDITGIGEGLVHPRFLDMVAEIKRRGCYLELFDPFHRWTPTVTERMLDLGLNRIQPSVDGATKETYEKIRARSSFDTVCVNLSYLFQAKERRGLLLPIVDFHYIVQRDNAHEMVSFVHLVRRLARDQRVGIQFTQVLRDFPGCEGARVPITEDMIGEVREAARECAVQVWFNRNAEAREKADMRDCNAWQMPFVFVDGHVMPCCAMNESNDRDKQRRLSMGNILTDRYGFLSIWNGKQYTELRRKMRRGETPDYCHGCPEFKAKK